MWWIIAAAGAGLAAWWLWEHWRPRRPETPEEEWERFKDEAW